MTATIDEFLSSLSEEERQAVLADESLQQEVANKFSTPAAPSSGPEVKQIPRDVKVGDVQASPEVAAARDPLGWIPTEVTADENGALSFGENFDLDGYLARIKEHGHKREVDALAAGGLDALGESLKRDFEQSAKMRQGVDEFATGDLELHLWKRERGLIPPMDVWETIKRGFNETIPPALRTLGRMANRRADGKSTLLGIGQGMQQNAEAILPSPVSGRESSNALLRFLWQQATDDLPMLIESVWASDERKWEMHDHIVRRDFEWKAKAANDVMELDQQAKNFVEKHGGDVAAVNDARAFADLALDPIDWAAGGTAAGFKTLTKTAPVRYFNAAARAESIGRMGLGKAALEGTRDALVAQIPNLAEAEAKAARRTVTKLDSRIANKQKAIDTATSDLSRELGTAGRVAEAEVIEELRPGIGSRTAGGALEVAGKGADKVGNAFDRMTKFMDRTLERVAPGDSPTQSFIRSRVGTSSAGYVIGGLPGAAAGFVGRKVVDADAWHSLANTLREAGRQLRIAPSATVPLMRRLEGQTNGLSKHAAGFVNRAVAWSPVNTVKEGVKGAAKASAVSGGLNYAISGGDVEAAVANVGAIGPIGFTVGATRAWTPVYKKQQNAERLEGDRRLFAETLPGDEGDGIPSQRKMFESLPLSDQWMVAQRAVVFGDLNVQFYQGEGKEWGSWDRDRRVARLNVNNKQAAQHFTVAHEAGHYMQDHGLSSTIVNEVIGNPETGQPGMYAEKGDDGLAIVENGKVKTNAEFQELKQSYASRLDPAYRDSVTDETIALEVFAEHVADRLLAPGLLEADVRGGPLSLLANKDWFQSPGFVGDLLGSMGFVLDKRGAMVEGTGLFTARDGSNAVPRNSRLEKIIRDYNRNAAGGVVPDWDMKGDVNVTPDAWAKNPDALNVFQASSDVNVNPKTGQIEGTKVDPKTGKLVIVDRALIFREPKEQKSISAEMADVIRTKTRELASHGKLDPNAVQERTYKNEKGVESKAFYGRFFPQEVIDALRATGKFNPHQLKTLEAVNASLVASDGQQFAFAYQPAQARGKRGYKTLPMGWRTEIPYNIFLAADNNVLFRTVSVEKVVENARREVSKGRAKLWDNNLSAVVSDIHTYLTNLSTGKPGDEGIGIPKRDFLNNLLGIRTKGSEDVNPFFSLTTKRPDVVITARRLDRINRLTPDGSEKIPFSSDAYNRGKNNLRPGDDSGFTTEEAESIRKGGERAVEQSMGRSGVADREAGAEVGSAKPQLAGERLPHAVEADELKLIHFSGNPSLSSIDPKHFGKGYATALDRRGDPKSYFFVQGSDYGTDKDLVTGDRKALYGATISGARIYDMNADALGILKEPNRQTRDEILKDAGYAGLSILTTDNRNVVALFEPVGVKPLQSDTQQFRPGDTYSWMKPDGSVIAVDKTHGNTAQKEFKTPTAMEAMELAWSRGWLRVANQGDDLYVHTEGGRTPSVKQVSELQIIASENGKTRIVLDNGNSHRILWTENEQLRPADFDPEEFLRKAVGDSMENLRLKTAKRKGTGVAKNPQTRFHDPQGRPIYVGALQEFGGKSFPAWIEETESWLNDTEIATFRNWYSELHDKFVSTFGEKEAPLMMVAWLAAQQNVSPSGALGNVFKVEDSLAGIGTGKKGGLADGKIRAILSGDVPDGGFGPKLSDFVDAGFLRAARTYMAGKPEGGAPFVADVHTGRDSGHVDSQTLRRLAAMSESGELLIDGKSAKVVVTETKKVKVGDEFVEQPVAVSVKVGRRNPIEIRVDMIGSPGSTQYEGISEWGNELSRHLNETGWKSGNWTPAEVQAVGWMRVLSQYGLPQGSVESALAGNTQHVFAEVNYASGSILPATLPEFGKLPIERQREVTNSALSSLVPQIASAVGGSTRVRRTSPGDGVFGEVPSPIVSVEVMGSAESVDAFAVSLAFVTEQTATMSLLLGTGGANNRAVTFRLPDGSRLSPDQVADLLKTTGLAGFTYRQLADGSSEGVLVGSRPDYTPKSFTAKQAAEVSNKIADWAEAAGLEIDIQDRPARVSSYTNDWKNNSEGQGYRDLLQGWGASGRLGEIDRLRGEYRKALSEAVAEDPKGRPPEALKQAPEGQDGGPPSQEG